MRDISALPASHKSSAAYTANTDLATVFAGNSSCVLAPEQTEGPYCEPTQNQFIMPAVRMVSNWSVKL